jgi:CBS domain-containing protein
MDSTLRERADHAVRPAVFVAPDDPLRAVAQRLWEEAVGVAVVAADGDVLGVVSERDIVAQLSLGANPDATIAREAMTRHVISARPDDRLLDVAFLMIDGIVRHIPIVDQDDDVVGMVSIRDLVRPLLAEALISE